MATTFFDIQTWFHTMPQTKFEFPDDLEAEWLLIAVSDYELNMGCELGYDPITRSFPGTLNSAIRNTLAQLMYREYLKRELDKAVHMNGIYGKDVTLTGLDTNKRVMKQEYDTQNALIETLYYRQKNPAYN